ncbi:MAG TPA: hypothetical protein P5057_06770, partial [Acidobacteriota bacterium]|nr:hypothetical protein [Acidobacteriota bacterium]
PMIRDVRVSTGLPGEASAEWVPSPSEPAPEGIQEQGRRLGADHRRLQHAVGCNGACKTVNLQSLESG